MTIGAKSIPRSHGTRQSRHLRGFRPLIFQFLRYAIAGGLALGVHLAVLASLVDGFGLDETLASAIGFCCAVPINYTLQRRLVFRSAVPLARSFVAYCAVTFAMLGLNVLIFWVLFAEIGLHFLAAQVVTTVAIVMLNYIANRSITFPAQYRQ